MYSIDSHNFLDTHKDIFLTKSCHSCGIADSHNDMHDIDENSSRALPAFNMIQNVVPVPYNSFP